MKGNLVHRTASAAIALSLAMGAQAAQAEETTATDAPKIAFEALDTDFSLSGEADPISVSAAPSTANTGHVTVPAPGPVDLSKIAVEKRSAVVDPVWGDIDPFYGHISPFYGDIDAFWGHISPFYGDISPFYGDISPFYGDISPFYGDISPFWGDIDAFWGDISPFHDGSIAQIGAFWTGTINLWRSTETSWAAGQYLSVGTKLNQLVADSEAQFGANYLAKTGKSFRAGFAAELFARHGIDPSNPLALAKLTDRDRARFFMDWHDSLNQYSGIDAVDHWMQAINWTPAITQQQGGGRDAVIGIIDSRFDAAQVRFAGGEAGEVDGHGAGVASLIIAEHDGEGTMGIAPNAKVVAYNPFDENGHATWTDVANGIAELKTQSFYTWYTNQKVSIINLSLGEKGYALSPNVAQVFADPGVAPHADSTIYVLAAGNEGIAQTQDVDWDFKNDTAFILVGSVDPTGEISAFSNTPGEACLLDAGVCREENKLFNRFVVAPGEMLLVDDGNGGVARRSGTSFAAPLVSGAVALLHDFWPWLAKHPHETADIIFKTARDLGEAGPDSTYGWGLVDVTASQAPIDFNNLEFEIYQNNVHKRHNGSTSASQLLSGGFNTNWEANNARLTMFEYIGDTHRDFFVPLSSALYGTKTKGEFYQQFVQQRFLNWLSSGGSDTNGDGAAGFSDLHAGRAIDREGWSFQIETTMPRFNQEGIARPDYLAASLFSPDGQFDMTMGSGRGTLALAATPFQMATDSDPTNGGVNPILGFAAGDSFAGAGYMIGKNTRVSVGYSENRYEFDELDYLTDQERVQFAGFDGYAAEAFTMEVEQFVGKNASVSLQYTHLVEDAALLGTQGTDSNLLGDGSESDAVTVSATLRPAKGLTLDLSATASRTSLAAGQALSDRGGVWSTAGQFTATKRGVLGARDILRVAVSQPLTIESGEIDFLSYEVIDRETGEIGLTTQTFTLSSERRIAAEAVYAMPVGNNGEFGLYGRVETTEKFSDTENYIVGGNLSIRF